ncbi:MAG: hypothetical protein AAF619_07090 [Pseudomonadota bacterium]
MVRDDLDSGLVEGARNLLLGCGEFQSGDHLLIVQEDPSLGWYDADAPRAVAEEAKRLGMTVEILDVGAPSNTPDPNQQAIIDGHQNVIFFARLGDQDRFEAHTPPGFTRVMSYIRSAEMLASPYGRTPYAAMKALKGAVNTALLEARHIEVTCPRGSLVTGTVSPNQRPDGDVAVRRFPLGVPIPHLAETFSGRVVLADYLTPTGSKVYEPASVAIDEPVIAHLENGRIARFEGKADVVERVEAHYDHVAALFDLDRAFVHSWHAGIHPGLTYDQPIDADPDRWSNTSFVQPRYLHFHTCGAYPPGEICWMVAKPTVRIDGEALWDGGRLVPERLSETRDALEAHGALKELFHIG